MTTILDRRRLLPVVQRASWQITFLQKLRTAGDALHAFKLYTWHFALDSLRLRSLSTPKTVAAETGDNFLVPR